MAIQNRRGAYSNFAASKMVPGEFAVVQSGDPNGRDGQAVYIAFNAGQAKRLSTYEDMQSEIESATEDIVEQIEEGVADDVQAAQAAATTATTKATEAAASATQAAQTVANIIDNTLTQTGKAADAKKVGDELSDLKSDLTLFNSIDLLEQYVPLPSATNKGVNYSWNNNVCHVSGTATDISIHNIALIPDGTGDFEIGKKYYIRYRSSNVMLMVYFYEGANYTRDYTRISFYNDGEFIVPDNTASMFIRLRVNSGTTVDEYVSPHIITALENVALDEKINRGLSSAFQSIEEKLSTGFITGEGNPIVLNNTSNDYFDILASTGTNPSIKVFGKNIARPLNILSTLLSRNNVDFTFNHSDGSIRIQSSGATDATISGNYTTTINGSSISENYKFIAREDCYVTISANCTVQPPYIWEISDGKYTHCQMQVTYPFNGNNLSVRVNKGITLHLAADDEVGVRFYIDKGWEGDMTFYPQIEIGAIPTNFEPVSYAWTTGLTNSVKNAFTLSGATGEKIVTGSKTVNTLLNVEENSLVINTDGAAANNAIGNLFTSNGNYAYLCHLKYNEDTRVYFDGVPENAQIKASVFYIDSNEKKEIVATEYGNGKITTLTANTDYYYVIIVYSGAVLDNLVLHPVISTGLYAVKSNDGITTLICDDDVVITAKAKTRTAVEEASHSNLISEKLELLTGGILVHPFKNYGRLTKPIITFTDDDAASVESVTRYFNALDSVGVVGNYAIIADYMINNTGEKELLLSYENKGWGCLYHCASQGADPSSEGAKYLKPYRDMTIAENNFVRGLRAMNEAGFLDYKYWITPYGVDDDEIISLARRHGMQCLITAGSPGYITPSNCDRWHIPRWHFTPDEYAARGLSFFYELVKSTIAQNGWLIILTHATDWDNTSTMDTALANAAQYAINAGMEVRNFPDAFEIYRPFFYMNELF